MADLQEVAAEALDGQLANIRALRKMIEDKGEEEGDTLIKKDKVRAIEVLDKIATTVFDRAYPKLSASKNMNVDLNVAKMLSALPTHLLEQVGEHIALQEPKNVEADVRPCPK